MSHWLIRTLQILLGGCGVLAIAVASSSSIYRDTEGLLTKAICLPIAVGAGLVLVACLLNGNLKRFVFWFAIAVVGQAAALQSIDAGTSLHYQHYKPVARLYNEDPALLILLALQAGLVLYVLRCQWATIREGVRSPLKGWQVA